MKNKQPFSFKLKKCPNCTKYNYIYNETCRKCGYPFEDTYTLSAALERKEKKSNGSERK